MNIDFHFQKKIRILLHKVKFKIAALTPFGSVIVPMNYAKV